MKKINLLSMLISMAMVLSMITFSSCTKEGPQGPAGTNGENGINGTDGTATCGACHDMSETVETKILQWGNSIHATGGNYARNSTDCAICHTSQGFRERVLTGADTTASVILNPSNINCYTCHDIHDTYTVADWGLRVTDPVTLFVGGATVDFGKGNICASCHQARPTPMPDVNNPSGLYNITSSHWGPHHGPQSSMMTGAAAFMVGSGYPTTNPHMDVVDKCVTCHMADGYGAETGGHTWTMARSNGAVNTTGCLDCHHTDAEANQHITTLDAQIEDMMSQLMTLLVADSVFTESGSLITGNHPNIVAGCAFNYIYVEEDRSMGLHNPPFVKALLQNSIDALQSRN